MVAGLVLRTGWTWDYCEDNITASRLFALYDKWATDPPLVSIATWIALRLGYKRPEGKVDYGTVRTPEQQTAYRDTQMRQGLEWIMGTFPDGVGRA